MIDFIKYLIEFPLVFFIVILVITFLFFLLDILVQNFKPINININVNKKIEVENKENLNI